ncbi:MAG: LamB/YcsF family protein [Thermoanaerobaculales bacterium]
MTLRVDLNCDLGESFGPWQMGADEAVMPFITSANVACGVHAGDPGTMRRTVELAYRHRVAIGAHPGLPDRVGFGRRAMAISPEEAHDLVLSQIGALDAFVRAAGSQLRHVKAHGALYNQAVTDEALAEAIAAAAHDFAPALVLVGLPSSALERAAARAGVPFAAEVFADRNYRADGTLTPRSTPGALVSEPSEAAARAVAMVREGRVRAVTGEWVTVRAETICIHGDNPAAVAMVEAIRRSLEAAGVEVAPLASRT